LYVIQLLYIVCVFLSSSSFIFVALVANKGVIYNACTCTPCPKISDTPTDKLM